MRGGLSLVGSSGSVGSGSVSVLLSSGSVSSYSGSSSVFPSSMIGLSLDEFEEMMMNVRIDRRRTMMRKAIPLILAI